MEDLIIVAILLPVIVANLGMGMAKRMAAGMARAVERLASDEELADPALDRLRRRVHHLLTLAKLGVAAVGAIVGLQAMLFGGLGLDLAGVAALVGLTIAFANGADLGRVMRYARHDARLMGLRNGEVPAGRVLAPMLAVGLATNVLLLVLWTGLAFVLQVGARAAMGLSVFQWAGVLWLAGLLIGVWVAGRVARNESRFLMREELGVGLFLGLMGVRELGRSGKRRAMASLRGNSGPEDSSSLIGPGDPP